MEQIETAFGAVSRVCMAAQVQKKSITPSRDQILKQANHTFYVITQSMLLEGVLRVPQH